MHAPLSPAFRVEWRTFDALSPIAEEWRGLAARTLEPNVFYEPSFALHAAPVFGNDAGAALVWSDKGRLLGLFPARIERWRGGVVPVLTGWTHPYAPLGTPLVDRVQAEAVIAAWLGYLAADRSMPALALIPLMPERGPFAAALGRVLERTGRRSATFGRHQRALLDPGAHRSDYLDRAISAGRRKELRRQRRRLEEIAPVTFATATAAPEVAAALKDFLVLEASGWKGLSGTAAVNTAAVRTFIEAAVPALAAEGKACVHRLMLNGRAIAASITLLSGDAAWCWKIAYSEGVSRSSPGVQLLLEVTDALLADSKVSRADSCATPDHPMIDHVWRERLPLCDRLIAVRPSALRFALASGVEAVRQAAVALVKSGRGRARRPKATATASGLRAQQPPDHLAGGGHRHRVDERDLARVLMRR